MWPRKPVPPPHNSYHDHDLLIPPSPFLLSFTVPLTTLISLSISFSISCSDILHAQKSGEPNVLLCSPHGTQCQPDARV